MAVPLSKALGKTQLSTWGSAQGGFWFCFVLIMCLTFLNSLEVPARAPVADW